MDPNFIHMDWERSFDALTLVVVLAIIVERALTVIFQNRIYIERYHRDGMKETVALAASIAACAAWKFRRDRHDISYRYDHHTWLQSPPGH